MNDVKICQYIDLLRDAERARATGQRAAARTLGLKALKVNHSLPQAHEMLGEVSLATGEWRRALSHFEKSFLWRRGSRSRYLAVSRDVESFVTFPKLRHDLEQFEHLISIGALPRAYNKRLDGLRKLVEDSKKDKELDGGLRFTADVRSAVADFYGKAVHVYSPGPIRGGALNPKARFRDTERAYFSENARVTWIDDLLTPKALGELRRFCLESTFWYDTKLDGYLGAYLRDGFSCGLLLQIAEELKAKLPRICGDVPLRQAWAYKYDQKLKGIAIHADEAKINCNFWITPDSANLKPETGGMVVWSSMPPSDWTFADYNGSIGDVKRKEFVKNSRSSMMRIPYRQNRMVIFDSMYFHKTDNFSFAAGYENRRINITYLFGAKGGSPSP